MFCTECFTPLTLLGKTLLPGYRGMTLGLYSVRKKPGADSSENDEYQLNKICRLRGTILKLDQTSERKDPERSPPQAEGLSKDCN